MEEKEATPPPSAAPGYINIFLFLLVRNPWKI